jgi:hypothetical protein
MIMFEWRKNMANKPVTKEISRGICGFCKGEIEKAKMTQHLRYCKQRAAEEASSAKSQKTKLFHVVVEGRYNPQYWMHLEMPASDSLGDLDSFLRDIWLECCGHLSGFKIGDTEYSSEPEELFYFGGEEEFVENDSEEEEETIEELLDELPPVLLQTLPPDLLKKLKEFQSVDDVVQFLRAEQKSIKWGGNHQTNEEWEEARTRWARKQVIEWLLDALEDRSLDVTLEKVLKVGQKCSYEYDYGSTTDLNLRVVAEREGVVQDKEEDNIEILARNIPPVILCKVCGQPAKKVVSGYFDVEENAYCSSKCARKAGADIEMMLPVVNSPRVGVCGYTG